jgi:hypothetical protein
MRSLLTDFNQLSSDQGSGIMGSMSGINHSLESGFASKGVQATALARANQWQNEAALEMAKNKVPPSAGMQSSGWQGAVSAGLQGVGGIVKALQAGAPGTGNFDVSGPIWTSTQQEFTDFYNSGSGIADAASSAGFGVDLASGADFSGAWDGSLW